jgi:hypothetical protein
MDQRWANSLGGCSAKLSREHLVSAGLFTDMVDVHGFSWCKDEWKRIGLTSLTAKILCEKHNSALSDVDEVGQKAFCTFQEHARVSQVRKSIKQTFWSTKRYVIDGCGLERWFLKTLINLSSGAQAPIGTVAEKPGYPSRSLVRIAYGLGNFTGRAGLYIVSRKGMLINQEDVVSCAPLIASDGPILGGTFTFRGFKFLLYLQPSGPPDPFTGIEIEGEWLDQCAVVFHPGNITEYWPAKRKSQVIQFVWNACTRSSDTKLQKPSG